MNAIIVSSTENVTLLGGGKARPDELDEALGLAPVLVAADGGAAYALARGRMPEAVIGDLDSLPREVRDRIPAGRVHEVGDQISTDFDKALRSIRAPLVLGVGFLGRRVDHQLACFNVLVRRADQPCILIGKHDVVFAALPHLSLDLPAGSRVSLFPMAPVTGRSAGLHWALDGLEFTPGGVVGTSNRVAHGHRGAVDLAFDGPGMLVILPRRALGVAMRGILARNDPDGGR
ncbi:thiamine diphosphokinase [Tropicimonas sp.]|uniref:thiamine diphosphokinase n=1 Tax=Tropicimonas sp. TaxID=2067044 RepID=UPI003A86406B